MKHLPTAILFFLGCLAHCNCEDFQPSGKFDLSPQDIVDLCTVVDGSPPPTPSECVYMKWVPCEGSGTDGARPCGWYQQTKCSEGRKKRDAGTENFEEPERNLWSQDGQDGIHEEVFIGWPNEK